jgi:hypothetical protein
VVIDVCANRLKRFFTGTKCRAVFFIKR